MSRSTPDRSDPKPPHLAVAEVLWRELEQPDGSVDMADVTDEFLERMRVKIATGEIPAFVPYSYQQGWYILARAEVSKLFARYTRRAKARGHTVRNFVPVIAEVSARRWVRADADPRAAIQHAEQRFKNSIHTAIWLQGAQLTRFRAVTWDELAQMAHQQVDHSTQSAKELDAQADDIGAQAEAS